MYETDQQAWVVSVDMGLGHQRATDPLLFIARGGIITVGNHSSTDVEEQKLWRNLLGGYEFLSRVRSVPIVGKPLFGILDSILNIPPMYPIRDMSKPTFQTKLMSRFLKKGLCKGMLEKIQEEHLPLITSYPAPALAADRLGYGRIYCIISDTDISRAWVPEDPAKSRIHYLAPCGRSVKRLKTYGIPDERIFVTGFPFPLELLGNQDLNILKYDVGQRLHKLDPNDRFWPLHGISAEHFLGKDNCKPKDPRPFTITYAVGGAGAQKEIGAQIAESFRYKINQGIVKLNLVAGIRPEIKSFFEQVKMEVAPASPNINIVYGKSLEEYFRGFSQIVRTSDVLWTKPSELSFYCGLGIPIIMAPPIGPQEDMNRRWLMEIQAGIDQEDPVYADQWLWDLLQQGRLAESAWDGFLKARKYGTYKILELLETGTMSRESNPIKR